jgi:hypothetical protein
MHPIRTYFTMPEKHNIIQHPNILTMFFLIHSVMFSRQTNKSTFKISITKHVAKYSKRKPKQNVAK